MNSVDDEVNVSTPCVEEEEDSETASDGIGGMISRLKFPDTVEFWTTMLSMRIGTVSLVPINWRLKQ